MKNLFVSNKLAVLAKNKGFDEYCLAYYTHRYMRADEIPCPVGQHEGAGIGGSKNSEFEGNQYFIATAPTIEQIVDWLDMKHGILVQVTMDITGHYYWQIGPLHPESTYKGDWKNSPYMYGRKEAWIDGIETALNLLP